MTKPTPPTRDQIRASLLAVLRDHPAKTDELATAAGADHAAVLRVLNNESDLFQRTPGNGAWAWALTTYGQRQAKALCPVVPRQAAPYPELTCVRPPGVRVEASVVVTGTSSDLPQLSAELVLVSPHLAGAWLTQSRGNRPLRAAHVRWLAEQMKAGAWSITGQAVLFSAAGKLLDGHHRLQAIQLASVSVHLLVVRGLAEDVWGKIDCGVVRSLPDRFQVYDSHSLNRRAVEIMQQLRRIETKTREKVYLDELKRDLVEYGASLDAILAVFDRSIAGITRAPALGALVRFHQRAPHAALTFAACLKGWRDQAEDTPPRILAEWMSNGASRLYVEGPKADPPSEIYGRTIWACLRHCGRLPVTAPFALHAWPASFPIIPSSESAA